MTIAPTYLHPGCSHRFPGTPLPAKIVVIATHDHDLVSRVCNRVCELQGGHIVFLGTTEEWLERNQALAAQAQAALPA